MLRNQLLSLVQSPADALSSASLSGVKYAPILLAYANTIESKVLEEIRRLSAQKVYILGGTEAISENVVNSIKTVVSNVQRLSGIETL